MIWPFLALYALWLFYLAIMSLKDARDGGRLTKTAYYMAVPMFLMGWLLDFLVNVVVMTVVLFELPKEALVTSRVTRHKYEGTGWRKEVAEWMCKHLLDPFDPSGCHCKKQ